MNKRGSPGRGTPGTLALDIRVGYWLFDMGTAKLFMTDILRRSLTVDKVGHRTKIRRLTKEIILSIPAFCRRLLGRYSVLPKTLGTVPSFSKVCPCLPRSGFSQRESL